MESSIFIIVSILLFGGWKIISFYNSSKKLIVLRDECFANVLILIQKRLNLFEQILRLLDAYNIHERGIFKDVAKSFGEGAAEQRGALIGRAASLHMHFPDVKSKDLFSRTMSDLLTVEGELQYVRERVNRISKSYNTLIAVFPNNYISLLFGFFPVEYLTEGNMGVLDDKLILLADTLK